MAAEEVKLCEQRLHVAVDFEAKRVWGRTTLLLEFSSAAAAAVAAGLRPSFSSPLEQQQQQQHLRGGPLRRRKPRRLMLPLQQPPACAISAVSVEGNPTTFVAAAPTAAAAPRTGAAATAAAARTCGDGHAGGRGAVAAAAGDVPGEEDEQLLLSLWEPEHVRDRSQEVIHFDLLTLRQQAAKISASRDAQQQLLVELPAEMYPRFAAAASSAHGAQRLSIDVDFSLEQPLPQTSPLYFVDSWISLPRSYFRLFPLLLTSSSLSRRGSWFPTVPIAAYFSTSSSSGSSKGAADDNSNSSSSSHESGSSNCCARCRWTLAVDVPQGYMAVAPGKLVSRLLLTSEQQQQQLQQQQHIQQHKKQQQQHQCERTLGEGRGGGGVWGREGRTAAGEVKEHQGAAGQQQHPLHVRGMQGREQQLRERQHQQQQDVPRQQLQQQGTLQQQQPGVLQQQGVARQQQHERTGVLGSDAAGPYEQQQEHQVRSRSGMQEKSRRHGSRNCRSGSSRGVSVKRRSKKDRRRSSSSSHDYSRRRRSRSERLRRRSSDSSSTSLSSSRSRSAGSSRRRRERRRRRKGEGGERRSKSERASSKRRKPSERRSHSGRRSRSSRRSRSNKSVRSSSSSRKEAPTPSRLWEQFVFQMSPPSTGKKGSSTREEGRSSSAAAAADAVDGACLAAALLPSQVALFVGPFAAVCGNDAAAVEYPLTKESLGLHYVQQQLLLQQRQRAGAAAAAAAAEGGRRRSKTQANEGAQRQQRWATGAADGEEEEEEDEEEEEEEKKQEGGEEKERLDGLLLQQQQQQQGGDGAEAEREKQQQRLGSSDESAAAAAATAGGFHERKHVSAGDTPLPHFNSSSMPQQRHFSTDSYHHAAAAAARLHGNRTSASAAEGAATAPRVGAEGTEQQHEEKDVAAAAAASVAAASAAAASAAGASAAAAREKKQRRQHPSSSSKGSKSHQREGDRRRRSSSSAASGAAKAARPLQVPSITYLTLQGFDSLISPTTAGVPLCFRLFARAFCMRPPLAEWVVAFLPIAVDAGRSWALPFRSSSLDAASVSQGTDESTRGAAEVTNSSACDVAVAQGFNRGQLPEFLLFGNLLVLPLGALHSRQQVGGDDSCYEARLLLAEGLAWCWLDAVSHFFCCPLLRRQLAGLYLFLLTSKILVDMFVEANFGTVELKIRQRERLQRYVTLVEAGAEEIPLDPLAALQQQQHHHASSLPGVFSSSSLPSSSFSSFSSFPHPSAVGAGVGAAAVFPSSPLSLQQPTSLLRLQSGGGSSSWMSSSSSKGGSSMFWRGPGGGSGGNSNTWVGRGSYVREEVQPQQQQQQQQQLVHAVPDLGTLLFSELYCLKVSVVGHALDRLLASQPLLHEHFFVHFLLQVYLVSLRKKKELPCVDRFWKRLLVAVTEQYILYWNSWHAHKVHGRKRLRLRKKKKKGWGVAALGLAYDGDVEGRLYEVNPQEHELLNHLEEALLSFRSAFISGTGCPQVNIFFVLHLQRKGSSMDFFNFYLDILSLQPPSSLLNAAAADVVTRLTLLPRKPLPLLPLLLQQYEQQRAREKKRQQQQHVGEICGEEIEQKKKVYDSLPSFDKRDAPATTLLPFAGSCDVPLPIFYPADMAGLAAVNLWEAQEILRLRQQDASAEVCYIGGREEENTRVLSSWEAAVARALFPLLLLPHSLEKRHVLSSSLAASLAFLAAAAAAPPSSGGGCASARSSSSSCSSGFLGRKAGRKKTRSRSSSRQVRRGGGAVVAALPCTPEVALARRLRCAYTAAFPAVSATPPGDGGGEEGRGTVAAGAAVRRTQENETGMQPTASGSASSLAVPAAGATAQLVSRQLDSAAAPAASALRGAAAPAPAAATAGGGGCFVRSDARGAAGSAAAAAAAGEGSAEEEEEEEGEAFLLLLLLLSLVPPLQEAALPSAAGLRELLFKAQRVYDPVDVVGRDGNFILGFGYAGDVPAVLNAGRGSLWTAIRDCLKQLQQQRRVSFSSSSSGSSAALGRLFSAREDSGAAAPAAGLGRGAASASAGDVGGGLHSRQQQQDGGLLQHVEEEEDEEAAAAAAARRRHLFGSGEEERRATAEEQARGVAAASAAEAAGGAPGERGTAAAAAAAGARCLDGSSASRSEAAAAAAKSGFINEDLFATLCTDNETAPPAYPVVSTGGLPYWALLLHQHEDLVAQHRLLLRRQAAAAAVSASEEDEEEEEDEEDEEDEEEEDLHASRSSKRGVVRQLSNASRITTTAEERKGAAGAAGAAVGEGGHLQQSTSQARWLYLQRNSSHEVQQQSSLAMVSSSSGSKTAAGAPVLLLPEEQGEAGGAAVVEEEVDVGSAAASAASTSAAAADAGLPAAQRRGTPAAEGRGGPEGLLAKKRRKKKRRKSRDRRREGEPDAARGGSSASAAAPAALLTPQNMGKLLCSSVGYEKYWLPGFCLQIIEDDGLRSSFVRLRECVLPLRFALDPRAERGRKKVASRGDRVLHGRSSSKLLMRAADAAAAATEAPAAAAAAASVAAAVDGVTTTATPAAAAAGGGGVASAAACSTPQAFPVAGSAEPLMRFVGELSRSDRGLIETLKRCVLAKNPSFLSLDNRSLVAKVNSKSKLPVLWLRADPTQTWIARVRRCQSGSMWEQQLLNDTNIYAQLEAAAALGHLPAVEEGAESLTDGGSAAAAAALPACAGSAAFAAAAAAGLATADLLLADAVQALAKALTQHRWHPFLRARVAYTLALLHNRTSPLEQTNIWLVFLSYMQTFHYDSFREEDRLQQVLARVSTTPRNGGGSGAALQAGAYFSDDWLPVAAAGQRAAAAARGASSAGGGAAAAALRLSETAASTPEIRFLLHLYSAASLLRDPQGLTRPEAVEMLLQPLMCTSIGSSGGAAGAAAWGAEAVLPYSSPGAADGSSCKRELFSPSVDLLCFVAAVIDTFGNMKCPYTPYPARAEQHHPYYEFLLHLDAGSNSCCCRSSKRNNTAAAVCGCVAARAGACALSPVAAVKRGGVAHASQRAAQRLAAAPPTTTPLAETEAKGREGGGGSSPAAASAAAAAPAPAAAWRGREGGRCCGCGALTAAAEAAAAALLVERRQAKLPDDEDEEPRQQVFAGSSLAAAAAAAEARSSVYDFTDADWEEFVTQKSTNGAEAAFLNIWRFFRLDSVRSLASPRHAISCAVLRVLSRQPTLRDLARRRLLRERLAVASPPSPSLPLPFRPAAGDSRGEDEDEEADEEEARSAAGREGDEEEADGEDEEVDSEAEEAALRSTLEGGTMGRQRSREKDHGAATAAAADTETEDETAAEEESNSNYPGFDDQIPFDFLTFIPLRSHAAYLQQTAYGAFEFLYAYYDVTVHQEAIRAQLLVCCEGAARVYRVAVAGSSRPLAQPRAAAAAASSSSSGSPSCSKGRARSSGGGRRSPDSRSSSGEGAAVGAAGPAAAEAAGPRAAAAAGEVGYTLVTKYVKCEEQIKRVQLGLGIYTAVQCAVEMERLLPPDDALLPITIWRSLLDVLQELRQRNPLVFLPFSTYVTELYRSEEDPRQQLQQQQKLQQQLQEQLQQQQQKAKQVGPAEDEAAQRQQQQEEEEKLQEFAVGLPGAPGVCPQLGCLGSCCSLLLPRVVLQRQQQQQQRRWRRKGIAAAAARSAAAAGVRGEQLQLSQRLLQHLEQQQQNHIVCVGLLVAQACSSYLSCYLSTEAAAAAGSCSFPQKLVYAQQIYNFLYGVDVPFCWRPVPLLLAHRAVHATALSCRSSTSTRSKRNAAAAAAARRRHAATAAVERAAAASRDAGCITGTSSKSSSSSGARTAAAAAVGGMKRAARGSGARAAGINMHAEALWGGVPFVWDQKLCMRPGAAVGVAAFFWKQLQERSQFPATPAAPPPPHPAAAAAGGPHSAVNGVGSSSSSAAADRGNGLPARPGAATSGAAVVAVGRTAGTGGFPGVSGAARAAAAHGSLGARREEGTGGAAAAGAAAAVGGTGESGATGTVDNEGSRGRSGAQGLLHALAGSGKLSLHASRGAAAEHILWLHAGSRQRKLWTFKRKYGDNVQHTTPWREVAAEAMHALMEMPEASWFLPDPETTVENYRKVISEPMWLRKVLAKLKAGLYRLPYHFKQDMALIFRNARAFNRPEDAPYKDCMLLEQRFNRLWTSINQAFQRDAAKLQRASSSSITAPDSSVAASSAASTSAAAACSTGSSSSQFHRQVLVGEQPDAAAVLLQRGASDAAMLSPALPHAAAAAAVNTFPGAAEAAHDVHQHQQLLQQQQQLLHQQQLLQLQQQQLQQQQLRQQQLRQQQLVVGRAGGELDSLRPYLGGRGVAAAAGFPADGRGSGSGGPTAQHLQQQHGLLPYYQHQQHHPHHALPAPQIEHALYRHQQQHAFSQQQFPLHQQHHHHHPQLLQQQQGHLQQQQDFFAVDYARREGLEKHQQQPAFPVHHQQQLHQL